MSKTTIADTRIRIKPTEELLQLIVNHKDLLTDIPENIAKILKQEGYDVTTSAQVELLKEQDTIKVQTINLELLADLCNDQEDPEEKNEVNNAEENHTKKENVKSNVYLYLNDLRWLNCFLTKLRKEKGTKIFLHYLIESSVLELPRNEIIERNPVLEARCQKLREEQENREYRKMTKHIDSGLKHHPEDTIAYQMKAINAQIIAVLQFVFSVVAGFVFGFLGIELIIGNLDFGLRLLLGIMFALIIALAEIYFLAKKLNEYDDIGDTSTYPSSPVKSTKKTHLD